MVLKPANGIRFLRQIIPIISLGIKYSVCDLLYNANYSDMCHILGMMSALPLAPARQNSIPKPPS